MSVITLPKKGDYIRTYSGVKFWPLQPDVRDINPRDIAHALAQKVRWQGHCSHFYSVGQHSLRVARAATIVGAIEDPDISQEEQDLLYMLGILHDANEAYLPDIPSPLKPLIKGWRRIENTVDNVILDAFGLEPMSKDRKRIVKIADKALLQLESDELFPRSTKKHRHWPLPKRMRLPEDFTTAVHVSLFPADAAEGQLLREMETILKINLG